MTATRRHRSSGKISFWRARSRRSVAFGFASSEGVRRGRRFGGAMTAPGGESIRSEIFARLEAHLQRSKHEVRVFASAHAPGDPRARHARSRVRATASSSHAVPPPAPPSVSRAQDSLTSTELYELVKMTAAFGVDGLPADPGAKEEAVHMIRRGPRPARVRPAARRVGLHAESGPPPRPERRPERERVRPSAHRESSSPTVVPRGAVGIVAARERRRVLLAPLRLAPLRLAPLRLAPPRLAPAVSLGRDASPGGGVRGGDADDGGAARRRGASSLRRVPLGAGARCELAPRIDESAGHAERRETPRASA